MTSEPEQPDMNVEETGEEEFFGYPQDYVFAIFDDPDQAQTAVGQLADLGFSNDDVATFAGDTGAESIDSSGSEHGVIGRLVRVVEKASANVDHMSKYEQAAAEGAVVVGVYAPEDDRRARATEVLLQHDTRHVNHFGSLVVETLRA